MARSIKVEGLDKLQKNLKDACTMDDVKRVIRHNGAELQSKMMKKADFKGHYEGNRFVPPKLAQLPIMHLILNTAHALCLHSHSLSLHLMNKYQNLKAICKSW